jgi:hypothetical protein
MPDPRDGSNHEEWATRDHRAIIAAGIAATKATWKVDALAVIELHKLEKLIRKKEKQERRNVRWRNRYRFQVAERDGAMCAWLSEYCGPRTRIQMQDVFAAMPEHLKAGLSFECVGKRCARWLRAAGGVGLQTKLINGKRLRYWLFPDDPCFDLTKTERRGKGRAANVRLRLFGSVLQKREKADGCDPDGLLINPVMESPSYEHESTFN